MQRAGKRNFLPLLAYVILVAAFLWWANFNKDIIPERAIGFVAIGGFLGVYVVLVVTALFAAKQRKRFGCACPNCKRELVASILRIAIASGRYGHCGGIVVEDWNK